MFWFRNWTLYKFIQQQQQPRVIQQKRIIVRSIRNYPNDKAFIRTNEEISKVWSTTTTLLMMMNRTKCLKSLSIRIYMYIYLYSTRIHTQYGEKKTKRFLGFVPVHIYEHLLTPNCLIKINSVDHCWQRCSESKCCDFNQYFFFSFGLVDVVECWMLLFIILCGWFPWNIVGTHPFAHILAITTNISNHHTFSAHFVIILLINLNTTYMA